MYRLKKILFFLLIYHMQVNAQWSTDPSENLQVSPWGWGLDACTDGEGGVFVFWHSHSGANIRIQARRVDKYGYLQWDDYIEIHGNGHYQDELQITPTGENNAIVAYHIYY